MQKYEILLNPSNKTLHFSIAPALPPPVLTLSKQATVPAASAAGPTASSAIGPAASPVPAVFPASPRQAALRPPVLTLGKQATVPAASAAGPTAGPAAVSPASPRCFSREPLGLVSATLVLGKQATVPAASAAGSAIGPVLAVFPASKLLYKKRNPRLSSRINFNLINL
ncbi:hypothetical protein [Sodaliphilus sp.]|uniref:hypothetical protein n=1 Tax=Sodaliphilus sp. TaxID=2815818 RepID=UPI00388D7203